MVGGNTLSQVSFRGRNDDGSETTATWIAGTNLSWSQRPDRNFRIRLEVDVITTNPGEIWLYRSLNGGAYTIISSSSNVVKAVSTIHYAHEDDSTQQIGSGDFQVDNNGMVNDAGITNNFSISANGAEVEYCVQIVGDDVSDGDSIRLRGQFGSALFGGGYLVTPDLTVDVPRTLRRTIIIQ